METIIVTVEIPRSVLAAAGVGEHELDTLFREAFAIDLYRRGQISLGRAAEVAGVATKWEMFTVLARHEVWIEYRAEDALQDAEAVAGVLSS